jgi:hypothetical protein
MPLARRPRVAKKPVGAFWVGKRVVWKPSGDLGTVIESEYGGFKVKWDDGKIAIYTHSQAECPRYLGKQPPVQPWEPPVTLPAKRRHVKAKRQET